MQDLYLQVCNLTKFNININMLITHETITSIKIMNISIPSPTLPSEEEVKLLGHVHGL